MTFTAMLAERFNDSAGRELLVTAEGEPLTYGDAATRARAFAASCRRQGVKAGDAIAVELANGPDVLVWYFACFFGGFVLAPVNPELSAEDRAHIRDVAKPRLSITSETRFEPIFSQEETAAFDWRDDSPGVIFFTSGTTGRPKGVVHSWKSMIENVVAFNERVGLDASARMLHVLPMAYMAGFLNTVLSPAMAGGTIVLGPRFGPQSALDFWSLPIRERVDCAWITPSIAASLVRMTRNDEKARAALDGFKNLFCGTAPLHEALRAEFRARFGRSLQESYGTSEQMLLAAQSAADAVIRQDVGEPLPTADLALVEQEQGIDEIFVASRHLGYMTENGFVAPVCDASGRTATGDAGRLSDGRLIITGRLKDLIIRGGVNVSPVAVENAFGDVAGVREVAVVGVPHAYWGETIVACLELEPGHDAAAVVAAVEERARERLGKACRPDRVVVVPALPRSSNGKIQKRRLSQDVRT